MSQSLNGLVPLIYNSLCFLRTSSNYDGDNTQLNAILNYTNNSTSTHNAGSQGWSASILDNNQYIMAGCDVPRTFMAFSIQGRGDSPQWVTSVKIIYSLDNVNWSEYRNGGAVQGNTDNTSVVTHFFDSPIRARSIAICPLTWNEHISLRCEFYTQPVLSTFTQVGQVESGESGVLNSGSGERNVVLPVLFPVEFSKVPKVTASFDYIDSSADNSEDQTRINVKPTNISTKGFDCIFRVWSTSRAIELRADYVAVCNE